MTALDTTHVVPLDALRRDVVARFAQDGSRVGCSRRIGAEIEFLVCDAASHRAVPIEPDETSERATLPILRRAAERYGWREALAPCGAPAFVLTNGGELSFEPGGQLEYSAPPVESASTLVADVRAVASTLRETLGDHGIELGEVGIDPCTPLHETRLQLANVSRYRDMDAYFASIGRFGARMMRQTASIQVSLDVGDQAREVWAVLNGVAPYALAVFANSAIHELARTGQQSYRAAVWRALDPARTGLRAVTGEPDEYLSFALDAPAMFFVGREQQYLPFGEWLESGTVTLDDWRTHLTTLFPEVRPRGHFEVRSCDAIPGCWYAAPILLFTGLAYDPAARREALELLEESAADATLLARAGICGVHDEGIRGVALQLFDLALRGCAKLGPRIVAPGLIDEAREFVRRFPARGRSLADDQR